MKSETSTLRTVTRAAMLATILSAALAAAASASRASDLPLLRATLASDRASFGAAESVVVHLEIANPTAAPAAILRWLTPADGLTAPLFAVERDGVPVAYVGKRSKRTAPAAGDYVTLAPGETLAWDVDLSDEYDFTVSGAYTIAYDVASASLAGDATDRLTSATIAIAVEGRANARSQKLAAEARAATNGFVGCDASQQSDVAAARSAATTYATYASAYLGSNIVNAHYTTWFGIFDGTRYATVTTHFTNILGLLGSNPMGFDCSGTSCDPGTYAFVFPSDATHTVHLCDAFWGAPVTGTDSRAGTLIHETSHFTGIAGTDDFAYGQSAAQALALSNPAQAIANADSHEYFAESSTAPGPTATPTATATPDPGATATPNGHGFVPPDATTAKCEQAVAKQLAKLGGCAASCQMKQADAAFEAKPFDEDACEDGVGKSCRSAYDAASAKLFAKPPTACPPCLDAAAQATLATDVTDVIDATNGNVYCAGTTAFGGDDTGFVPPDTDAASCSGRVAKSLKKLAACVAKCQAKQVAAAVKGKAFDGEDCKRTGVKSCRAAYDAASAKILFLAICPPCLDVVGQSDAADQVTSAVEGRNDGLYCAGTTPLP